MMITVQNLSFNYGKRVVLQDINLQFKVGFNVLLGPNGAGKSTLIALLTHLLKPSSGNIQCAGKDLSRHTHQVMSLFGVVFQQSTLDLDLSIAQNLSYYGALQGLNRHTTFENCHELLCHLNLDQRLNEKVRELNGGHRRRLEIIRALVHQPKILLLDEASVGLDYDTRNLIISYIRELAKTRALCVVWTTHLLDEISHHDYLVILKEGVVASQGKAQQLCQANQVKSIHDLYAVLTQQDSRNAI